MPGRTHLRRAFPPVGCRADPRNDGSELYFWSFVALLVFALGAGVLLHEGIRHMLEPEPIRNPTANYMVLALSFLFEGGSWWIARREFRRTKGDLGHFEAVRLSKDPSAFSVLFEDSAALLGLGLAFAGILGAQIYGIPELDGAASIGIAVVLAVTAMFLARESKGLLIGEAALPGVQDAILAIAQRDQAVQKANGVLTIHMGPREIVAAVSIEFEDHLAAPAIEDCVQRLEDRLKKEIPEVIALFVKPQTKGHMGNAAQAGGRSG